MLDPRPGGLQVPADYGLPPGAGPAHWPWAEAARRIADGRTWWIATTRPDGRPHVQPVWGVTVDERMVFSTDPRSRKARNLATNPAIALHLDSGDEVVIVEGIARRLAGSEVPAGFSAAYLAKYDIEVATDTDDPRYGFYEIVPVVAMTWSEAEFLESVVRWEF
jgi:Pyridoxamine 5'-phosphate oxidase